MAAIMAHNFSSNFGTKWAFEKEVFEDSQRSPSETSATDFAEIQDKFTLAPTMEEIRRTVVQHKSPIHFNERYMSSEEALSPTEHDSDTGADDDDDDDSVLEIGIAAPLRFTVCDMAVAICIVAVGKPKIVNISVPSLSSSPSTRSYSDAGRASWMPKRRPASSKPLKPILRQRNPNRPNLATLHSSPTLTDEELTSAATASSISSHNSPTLSSSSETPPTSTYTESSGFNSRRNSMFQPSSITSSPKKEFTIDRSSTTHSFLDHDPYENASPPRHKRHSRFRNLSQKIKLPRFGKSSNAPEEDANPPEARPYSPRPMSMTFSQSPPRRKMVARGAAEREPTIEIPPCPYDTSDEDGLDFSSSRKRRRSHAF